LSERDHAFVSHPAAQDRIKALQRAARRMTVVNLRSVKSYGESGNWFASIKVVAIIVFVVVGLSCAY